MLFASKYYSHFTWFTIQLSKYDKQVRIYSDFQRFFPFISYCLTDGIFENS